MERQLVLIEERGADYRLDERTLEIGRRGIAAARAALRSSGGNDSPTSGVGAAAGHARHGRKTAA
jgi:hypothetical protein